jgi:hypothetical protein
MLLVAVGTRRTSRPPHPDRPQADRTQADRPFPGGPPMDRTIPPSVSDLIARLQSHGPSSAIEQDYVVDAWLAGQEHHPEVMPEWGMDADVTDSVPFTVAGLPDTSGQTPPGVQTFGGDPIHGHDDPAVSGPAEDPGYDPRVTTPSWVLEPVAEEPATAPDPRVTTTVEDLLGGGEEPAEELDPRLTTTLGDLVEDIHVAPREDGLPGDGGDHAGEEVGIGQFEREQLEDLHDALDDHAGEEVGIGEFEREQFAHLGEDVEIPSDGSGEIIMIDPIESMPVGEDMPIEEYQDPVVVIDDPAPTGGDMPIEGEVVVITDPVPEYDPRVTTPAWALGGEGEPHNTGIVPPHITDAPHYEEPQNTGVVPPHITDAPQYDVEDGPHNTGVVPPHIFMPADDGGEVVDPGFGVEVGSEELPPELILVVEEGETPLGEGVIVDEPIDESHVADEPIYDVWGDEPAEFHADVMPEGYVEPEPEMHADVMPEGWDDQPVELAE